MKYLIINADDFGLHEQINKGIIKGYREGIITSTSIMPTAPAFEEAVALAKDNPELGIGIHLTLCTCVPSCLDKSKVTSLLGADGNFLPSYVEFAKRFYTGGVKRIELEAELRAQFEKALAAGINITHVDSHQHTHMLPGINTLVIKLCKEYNVERVRVPKEDYFFTGGYEVGLGRKIGRAGLSFCADLARPLVKKAGLKTTDHFFGMLAGCNLNTELVGNIIKSLGEGTNEMMTHPGLSQSILAKALPWDLHWENELAASLAEANKKLLEEHHVTLTNFGRLD
ncbi:MAG: ChbG/HpnK family deacetylase [Phascolarctobacterium sp.]|nr:ChbG/HpnK family deacetylase [Phascolarctobacterium sp.]